MKKVGLFGGTFNPPHIGHLMMANEVYAALDLAEIRFMPNAKPPHKDKLSSTTNAQRLRMVELAIEEIPYFHVETFELDRGGVSYTFDTMKAMREREPLTEFYFIIGGDMIDSLPTWHRIDELMGLVTFVGVKRPGSEAQTSYNVHMVDAPQIDLSSTYIRNRLQQHKANLHFILPKAVEQYIREEGLYGSSDVISSN
ncbi:MULTISPECIES: nicotinate-nucleotide adenylyltransferase [unclassified Solibacillus]|uniref:nicotinate-nucleotide adenylyltransferase n=1 Tax=unclassified Solibacillus TaxID=2637870 RepID=UPI0030F9E543